VNECKSKITEIRFGRTAARLTFKFPGPAAFTPMIAGVAYPLLGAGRLRLLIAVDNSSCVIKVRYAAHLQEDSGSLLPEATTNLPLIQVHNR